MFFKRPHKYRAQPTVIDGLRFDSKKEGRRYQELKMMERAGQIKNLDRQVKFNLQPKFECRKAKHRAIDMVIDFTYEDGGEKIAEDTKGYRTEVYKIKKKLFLFKYGNEWELVES